MKYVINTEVNLFFIYIFWIKFCAVYQILKADIGPGLSIIVSRVTLLFNIVPQNNSHSEVEWLFCVPSDSKFRKSILPTYRKHTMLRKIHKKISFISPTKFSL